MTPESQQRLCRAGIIIGALFCVAAVFEVSIGMMGLFGGLGPTEVGAMENPEIASQVVAETLIVLVVRLWPLPLALLFLVPSLIGYRRLRCAARAVPQ